MSKAIQATCTAGVVTADNLPVDTAQILSEGVASSEGALILSGDEVFYIPKTSGDLKSTLDKIASALGQIASALTAIDAKATGTLAPAPVASTQIVQITALQTELTALKGALK